jgi:hypothetical protein
MEFLKDMLQFLKARKKFWLTPIIIILVFVSILFVIGSSSVIAPFIYSLF